MIIYGSRMYGKKNKTKAWGVCPHCNTYAINESYDGRKFGHIYFIPLIPMTKPSRVIMECSNCEMGSLLKRDDLPTIIKELKNSCSEAFNAIQSGQENFIIDGEEVRADLFITNNVAFLQALNGKSFIDSLLNKAKEQRLSPFVELLEASLYEHNGHSKEAYQIYKGLKAKNDEDEILHVTLGEYMIDHGMINEAVPFFESSHEKDPEDVWALRYLLDLYTHNKQHEKLPEVYEKLIIQIPELKEDKKYMKQYKKACKKVKVEMRF